MKAVIFIAGLLLSFSATAQHFDLVQINADWNSKNNIEFKEVAGITFVEATCRFWENEFVDNEVVVTAQAGIDIHKKGMDMSQCFGSSSSYARKYALNGLFLIDDTKDADATNNHKKQSISNDRFEKACKLITEKKYTVEELKNSFELTELQEKALLTL